MSKFDIINNNKSSRNFVQYAMNGHDVEFFLCECEYFVIAAVVLLSAVGTRVQLLGKHRTTPDLQQVIL